MTEPRRRIPAGRRDAERLLDGHGRRVASPAAHGTDPGSPEERLAGLLADAAAPARHSDAGREREALQHFRAATRHTAPPRRGVRQRVAALSATAKVVTVAVGATATGGVALASATVPLGDGLRPFIWHTSDATPGRGGTQPAGTPSGVGTADGTATALPNPSSTGPTGSTGLGGVVVGDPGGQQDQGQGVPPGTGPTGSPSDRSPTTGPTTPETPPSTDPTTEPTIEVTLPPKEPTPDPTKSRAPGFEQPPNDADPSPGDSVYVGRPDPDTTASRTPSE